MPPPHERTALSARDVDALFARATQVRVTKALEPEARALVEVGPSDFATLRALLSVHDTGESALCHCFGDLSFHFDRGAEYLGQLRLHHGTHLETSHGHMRVGSALRDPRPLLEWLADRGVRWPSERFDEARGESMRVAQARWRAATPACLVGVDLGDELDVYLMGRGTPRLDEASRILAAAYHEPEQRTLALLAWYGASGVDWNGTPGHEVPTMLLLAREGTAAVLRALERDALSLDALLGAARHLHARASASRDELVAVPDALWACMRSAVVAGCDPACVEQLEGLIANAREHRAARADDRPTRLSTGGSTVGVARSFRVSSLRRAGASTYARDGDAIVRFDHGSTKAVVVCEGLALVAHFGVDATAVVVTETQSGSLFRVRHDRGEREEIARGEREPVSPIAADGEVYWIARAARAVRVVRKGGAPMTLAVRDVAPVRLCVDATHLHWLEHHGHGRVALMRVARGGGAVSEICALRAEGGRYDQRYWHLTDGPKHLYWFDPDAGALMQLAKAGGAPRALYRDGRLPHGIAADARGVCVAVGEHGQRVSCELVWAMADSDSAHALCEIVCDEPGHLPLALDASGLYWSEGNTVRTIAP